MGIKSIFHEIIVKKYCYTAPPTLSNSSPPNEQLSPPISQSLANSLASFFHQKIFFLKDSIALKLHSSPTPFDSDLPHSGEMLSDFTPVTPAEVSELLRSMSNKSSPLNYIPTLLLLNLLFLLNRYFLMASHHERAVNRPAERPAINCQN